METILSVLILSILAFGFLRLLMIPLGWAVKIGISSLAGFVCLWLLNTISGFIGLILPINLVTASIAGSLGIPGIILLCAAELIL